VKSTSDTSSARRGFFGDISNVFLTVCLLVFAVFLHASYQMEEASSYLLPRALGAVGLVLASIQLVLGYRKPIEETSEELSERTGLHVGFCIVFAAAYFYTIPLLGFVLSTSLAIVAFSYVTKFPRKKLVTILAVVIPVVLHLTFVELLKASLPAGIMGALFS
jgi:hypothetical protein